MYEIALCDDEWAELEKIEKLLSLYQQERKESIQYKIEKFESAEELLAQVRQENYTPDLLLLDIFMAGKTGMEAADELRKEKCDVPIVFLTASTEYALEAYELDAVQYLVKPFEKEKFFHAMDIAFDKVWRKEEPLVIKVAGGVCQMQPDDIFYCETQKNYQILYTRTENLRVRMTAGHLYEILQRFSQFKKCGSSYILNMNHIVALHKDEVKMDNGKKVYIPSSKAAEFKKAYFAYYFD